MTERALPKALVTAVVVALGLPLSASAAQVTTEAPPAEAMGLTTSLALPVTGAGQSAPPAMPALATSPSAAPPGGTAPDQPAATAQTTAAEGAPAPRIGYPGGPEGMPTREDIDRYVGQRQQEIDAQLRAVDPIGQHRRDWQEGRRELRRQMFPGAGPGPGYPWGPLAPYYGGGRWGEGPVAPVPPGREDMDELFERQKRAIEEQHRQMAPWTPGPGTPYGRRGEWAGEDQARRLRENPWAPAPQP